MSNRIYFDKCLTMKKIVFFTLLALAATLQAKTIASAKLQINPAEVDKVIRLVDKDEPGSSAKRLQIIVTDQGLATDVSPRYTIYLGYASLAEMGNMNASFKISDQAYQFVSAQRKAAGIYEVKSVEYRKDGMFQVTHEIDASKMFADEKKLRKQCGDGFCDVELKSGISVKEVAEKMP